MNLRFHRQRAGFYRIELEGDLIGVAGRDFYGWTASYIAGNYLRSHGGRTLADLRNWVSADLEWWLLEMTEPPEQEPPEPIPEIIIPSPADHARLQKAEWSRANAVKSPLPACFKNRRDAAK